MSDETYRPERRKPVIDTNATDQPQFSEEKVEPRRDLPFMPSEPGIEMKGNIPPQLRSLFQGQNSQGEVLTKQAHRKETQRMPNQYGVPENEEYRNIMGVLDGLANQYEPVVLPSKGRFYDGTDGPADGVVYLRAMTGAEENILATPRYVKRGKAIDMIFDACTQGKTDSAKWLSVDRTYLLIYLRGISYTANYDVEISCGACSHKFQTTIDLDSLEVTECPDDFGPESLDGVLPTSKFPFVYKLARGSDDAETNAYRERRSKGGFMGSDDDTLIYRTAILLESIGGIKDKTQIQQIIKKLPIGDVAHIRSLVNNPPFGVDTNVEMLCPSCFHEWSIDLPLEAGFFFPQARKPS